MKMEYLRKNYHIQEPHPLSLLLKKKGEPYYHREINLLPLTFVYKIKGNLNII